MNVRYKVFYCEKGKEHDPVPCMGYRFPCKNIRASSGEKAKEIFRTKYPNLYPLSATKW